MKGRIGMIAFVTVSVIGIIACAVWVSTGVPQ